MSTSAKNQLFLKELCEKLWEAANLHGTGLAAPDFRIVVLNLIFLRFLSDDSYQFSPEPEGSSEVSGSKRKSGASKAKHKTSKYLGRKSILAVPETANWRHIQEKVVSSAGVEFCQESGMIVRLRIVSPLIDRAFDDIEKANKDLKGVFPRISKYRLEDESLISLINIFSDSAFTHPVHKGKKIKMSTKEILRNVYKFFLEKFIVAEGKRGAEYYTPKNVVDLVVQMLQPSGGSVYDPAMGAGIFLLAADAFAKESAAGSKDNSGKNRKIQAYGQEIDPVIRKFSIMNMIVQDLDFNVGKKGADTFSHDQHPNLKADYAMCHPPFNLKGWWSEKLEGDSRWEIAGVPPKENANFAWLQHTVSHLSDEGSMALVIPSWDLDPTKEYRSGIIENLIHSGLLKCIVDLPNELFNDTSIPSCIWILGKNKSNSISQWENVISGKNRILFIDATDMGYMRSRIMRELGKEDISKIAGAFHAWKNGQGYENMPGFCYDASLQDIEQQGFFLVPKLYVNMEKESSGESQPNSENGVIYKSMTTRSENLDDLDWGDQAADSFLTRSNHQGVVYSNSVFEKASVITDEFNPDIFNNLTAADLKKAQLLLNQLLNKDATYRRTK